MPAFTDYAKAMTPEPPAQNLTEITRQVTSLAREIDRLPPGFYFVELEKSTRLDTWKAVIKDCSGEHVREMELRR